MKICAIRGIFLPQTKFRRSQSYKSFLLLYETSHSISFDSFAVKFRLHKKAVYFFLRFKYFSENFQPSHNKRYNQT